MPEKYYLDLEIVELRVWCHIGVYWWERIIPQRLSVALRCTIAQNYAPITIDDLNKTIDYTMLASYIRKTLRSGRYFLIETAVSALFDGLNPLCKYPKELSVRIIKRGKFYGKYRVGLSRVKVMNGSEE